MMPAMSMQKTSTSDRYARLNDLSLFSIVKTVWVTSTACSHLHKT